MQGMKFLLLNEQGTPLNHGVILQKVTNEHYLCTFARTPQVTRLCHVNEITGWNLFPNDEAMNAFILSIQAETGEPQKPVETPPGERKPIKKKKVPKKRSNAKTQPAP